MRKPWFEKSAETMFKQQELATLQSWLRAIPEEMVRCRPRLCIWHANLMLQSIFDYDAIERTIHDAERVLYAQLERLRDDTEGTAGVRHLLGQAAVLRVNAAGLQGDVSRAIEWSRKALDLLPEEDAWSRAHVFVRVGTAYLGSGDALAAEQYYTKAAKYVDVARFSTMTWGFVLMQQSRLRQAAEVWQESLRVKGERGIWSHGATHRFIGQTRYEWSDLDAAVPHLLKGLEIAEQWDSAPTLARCYLQLAWVHRVQGEVDRANEALERVTRLLPTLPPEFLGFSPAAVRAMQAHYRLAGGDLEAAVRWAGPRG